MRQRTLYDPPLVTMDDRLANGRGMTDCEVIGISGGCGPSCPVWQDGDCEEEPMDGDQHLLFQTRVTRK
jgi:hypothetical protein